jgi:hypothetical protein
MFIIYLKGNFQYFFQILPPNAELTSTNLDRSISQRSATNQSRFDNPYHSTRQYYVPTASHNDSEHHSQSSDCTSDSISFTDTSDGCMDDPRRKSKIEKVKKNHENYF